MYVCMFVCIYVCTCSHLNIAIELVVFVWKQSSYMYVCTQMIIPPAIILSHMYTSASIGSQQLTRVCVTTNP